MSDKPIPPEVKEFGNRVFELVDNPKLIFASESERFGAFFSHQRARYKDWEKSAPCMYRGCTARSIEKSHSIQRAGPIAHLAENGHVLTPQFENGALRLKLVGASSASTFPGFCSTHEQIFRTFETTGVISNQADVNLQIFRTVCRELRRKRYDADGLTRVVADIRGRLESKVKDEAACRGIEFNGLKVDAGNYGLADEHLAIAQKSLFALEGLYDAVFPSVDGSGFSDLSWKAFQINLAFPIALSGFVAFGFEGREVTCCLGVVPQNGGTLMYMAGAPGDQDAIDSYLKNVNLDLPLIDMVETWMVRASDHWFLRPSIWVSIPEARQQAILMEIMDVSKGLASGLNLSIFDDLRRSALAAPQAPNQTEEVRAYIEKQRAKLQDAPDSTGEPAEK
jgi:hypothetical protein